MEIAHLRVANIRDPSVIEGFRNYIAMLSQSESARAQKSGVEVLVF